MAAATAVVVAQDGGQQFRGVFSRVWTVRATLDSANVATGAGATDTVTVPGVAFGDVVLAIGFSGSLQAVSRTAYVSAANTVTIISNNLSGSGVDLASGTITLVIARPSFL